MNATTAKDFFDDPDVGAAEHWVIRLNSPDYVKQDGVDFEEWLAADPANPAAFARAQEVHALALELDKDDLLMAELRRARKAKPLQPRRIDYRWAAGGLAAALALAFAVPMWLRTGDVDGRAERYVTAVGEIRTINLPDRTAMQLDTDTEVSTRYGDSERRIDVVRGRAQFVVAPGDNRPLLVFAGDTVTRDIGTTFQVARQGSSVRVALVDGAVVVGTASKARELATLKPGQVLTYDAAGGTRIDDEDASQLGLWTQGIVLIREQRLDSLLTEMNRYSVRKIRLADAADGAALISGRYRTNDQEALLQSLEAGWSLHADRSDPAQIVLKRR